jgi:hypothetical protein
LDFSGQAEATELTLIIEETVITLIDGKVVTRTDIKVFAGFVSQ